MAMAMTMREYLRSQDIDYEEIKHPREVTANRIAELTHIAGNHLAKAVLLNGESGYRVAVLPSTCEADLDRLSSMLHERIGLASEDEVKRSFDDCDPGALTPLGQAYGLQVFVDDELRNQPDIYFEAGDHETLVHMSGREFNRLMSGVEHGHFSRHL
ncbi:aminoacyl-tRNA deacylase [Litchfieldella rifensis]|uniref:Aminoacyl-tRNA deacylase n=1 Tax=Litchfieldella rifensis TaxID=762643 RepID=A0ABV7LS22_9GAMM